MKKLPSRRRALRVKTNGLLQTNIFISVMALSVIAKLITGQNLFLLLFLLLSFCGIFSTKLTIKIVYLLFFSSWVYVLKLSEGGFTLFHFMQFFYVLSILFTLIINQKKINFKIITGFLLFSSYLLFNSALISNGSIIMIVGFILNFTTVALAFSITKGLNNFNVFAIYYAVGIVLSGLVSLIGNWIPNANEQIQNMGESYTVYQNSHLYSRFSGLDIDPNYFAIQVLFAISLLLVSSNYGKSNWNVVLLIFVLAFMGINSLSKMFLIMLSIMLLFTCLFYAKSKITDIAKYILILGFIFLAMIPMGLFKFLNVTFIRFSGQGKAVTTITTGRSDLWFAYLEEIFSNSRIFLIGNGIGSDFLGGFASHNMYLSYWYFTGVIGIIVFLVFIFNANYQISKQIYVKRKASMLGMNKLPLFILIVANLALDSIFMNFFPYLLYLTVLAANYTGEIFDKHIPMALNIRTPKPIEIIMKFSKKKRVPLYGEVK